MSTEHHQVKARSQRQAKVSIADPVVVALMDLGTTRLFEVESHIQLRSGAVLNDDPVVYHVDSTIYLLLKQ